MAKKTVVKINSFDLFPGRKIGPKYKVLSKLGEGWEGEVYKVLEISTGIERAAKLFYPQRNVRDQSAKLYAKKLHKLQACHILIHYHTQETITCRRVPVTALISEYVEGELLSKFLKNFPGNRLDPYKAVHLLHALTKGIEEIHLCGEYHGDLHTDNIIVNKYGLAFDLKLVDLFHLKSPKRENRREDICGLIQIFHETLGGARYYAKQPQAVKNICFGLKKSLILKKFRTVTQLRKHLEDMDWLND